MTQSTYEPDENAGLRSTTPRPVGLDPARLLTVSDLYL